MITFSPVADQTGPDLDDFDEHLELLKHSFDAAEAVKRTATAPASHPGGQE